jgi:hypothetical protein
MIITCEETLGRERSHTTHRRRHRATPQKSKHFAGLGPAPSTLDPKIPLETTLARAPSESRGNYMYRYGKIGAYRYSSATQLHTWHHYFLIVGTAQLNFFCEWLT